MTPERWQKIQDIFEQAVALTDSQREDFLKQTCLGDHDLYRYVEGMIAAGAKTGGFIEKAIVGAAVGGADEVSWPGRRIGPYRIERELGRGGMGEVFLAVRDDDEFEKQVAIKTARVGIRTDEILRRFRNERQILANLDHPNIARLLDGGTTENGTPYVVMDYVDGVRLDEYCDRNEITFKQRLEIFRRVCSAVSYAHQNLIIHRDIKPSNILVGEDGIPKLLDFGIAKLLAGDGSANGEAGTRTGVRLMTPEYASPEQVRGQQITTAADVYSLGVVLYELLTGRRPYDLENRSSLEIDRLICEQEPSRPSTNATARAIDRSTGDQRSRVTNQHSKALRGDLDNIILMALRKEPERRYSSVEQFSDDIRRHLEGLPVLARHDTFGYRANKFIRRHSVGVIASTAVAILIAALVGFYTWQLAEERNRARAEARKAEQVSQFLTQLFASSDPRETGGDKLTAKQILDAGADRIETELAGQPEVRAALMDVMGVAYQNLGLLDEAERLLRGALEIRQNLYGTHDKNTAESLNHLASVYIARTDYNSAEPMFRRALEIEQSLDNDSAEVADLLNNIAQVELSKGSDDEAERLYLEALALNRELFGAAHREIATNLSNLGSVMARKGETERALDYFRQGMIMRRTLLGDDHPDLAYSANNVAAMLHVMGRSEEAEPYYRQAAEIRRNALGEQHPMYNNTSANLALLLVDNGKLAEAESILERVLAAYERTIPFFHDSNGLARVYKATLHIKKGEYKKAEKFAREAIEIQYKVLPANSWRMSVSESILGEALMGQKKYKEAERLLTESYEVIEARLKPSDKRRREALMRIISFYDTVGNHKRADEYRKLAAVD